MHLFGVDRLGIGWYRRSKVTNLSRIGYRQKVNIGKSKPLFFSTCSNVNCRGKTALEVMCVLGKEVKTYLGAAKSFAGGLLSPLGPSFGCKFISHVAICPFPNKKEKIHTSFANPLQVPVELSFNLLLPSELQELPPVLHPLSLFGKLAADKHKHRPSYHLNTQIPLV